MKIDCKAQKKQESQKKKKQQTHANENHNFGEVIKSRTLL